jgi:hypothetical protein
MHLTHGGEVVSIVVKVDGLVLVVVICCGRDGEFVQFVNNMSVDSHVQFLDEDSVVASSITSIMSSLFELDKEFFDCLTTLFKGREMVLHICQLVGVSKGLLGFVEECNVHSPGVGICGSASLVDNDIGPMSSNSRLHKQEDEHNFVLIASEHVLVRSCIKKDLSEEHVCFGHSAVKIVREGKLDFLDCSGLRGGHGWRFRRRSKGW